MFKKISRWFRRPRISAGYVYYVKLLMPSGEIFYKIGFTSRPSIIDRFAYSGHGDEKLIQREFLSIYREDAWDVEQNLHEYFDKYRAFGKYSNNPSLPLAGRGQSELYRTDVLGLDDEQYLISEDLRKAISEDGEQAKDGCLMILIGLVLVPFTFGLSLFFLLGGGSAFFGSAKTFAQVPRRPEHTKEIQDLINVLYKQSAPA
jgi:hypothetical protein